MSNEVNSILYQQEKEKEEKEEEEEVEWKRREEKGR